MGVAAVNGLPEPILASPQTNLEHVEMLIFGVSNRHRVDEQTIMAVVVAIDDIPSGAVNVKLTVAAVHTD
jgi:hypothetical protein